MPRFSIIVPIYRSGKFLPWTLESILVQTFQDWEAILVDDGSGQAELTEIIEAAALADSRIRAAPMSANGGVSAARNHGLKEAKGDYFIFLDSDDLLLP
jgi:glycosyltransferase involved in cell wall biosynthesis